MNKDQILLNLYNFLVENLPEESLDIIIHNDIRVENYFLINSGIYFEKLLTRREINSYSLQNTISLNNQKRVHIDLKFTDTNNIESYLELKHFTISQNRGNGRRLQFYTNNSTNGIKVGIIGDCVKFDNLTNNNNLALNSNKICCAFITQKPNLQEIQNMENRFENCPELQNWNLIYPKPYNEQNNKLGMLTLQK